MDKEFDTDEKIKARLKVKEIKVPEDFDNKIDGTLRNLKSSNNIGYFKVASFLAVLLVGLLIIGVSNPIYAQKLKEIGSSFKNLGINENYDKYATEINVTKESNGIKLTILSVLYDGADMNIAYKVEGNISEEDPPVIESSTKVKYEDKEIKVNAGYSSGEFKGKNIFYGVSIFSFTDNTLSDLEKFNINLNINGLGFNTKGHWKYELAIENSEVINGSNVIKVNRKLENMKIKSIQVTPISVYIDYSVKWGKDSQEIIVREENGKELQWKSKEEGGRFFKKSGRVKYDNYNEKLNEIEIQVGEEKIKVKLNKL